MKSILGASALLVAASSQAAVVAYDDFATIGSLEGAADGAGFSGGWSGGTYTVAGGVVSGTGNALRSLENELGTNGTIWVSFDLGRTSGDSYGGLSFFEVDGSNSTERLIIGDRYKQGVWCLDHAGRVNTDISIDGMKTAVAKVSLDSGSVELWVGATNTEAVVCSGIADATVTAGTFGGVNTLRIGAGFALNFSDLIIADTAVEVGAVLGDDTSFNAATAGSWTNAANWSAGIPVAGDVASIEMGATVTLDAAASLESLAVKQSSSLTLATGGALVLGDALELDGTTALTIEDGATLTAGSNVTLGATTVTVGLGAGTSGELNAGGVLDLGTASLVLDGTIDGVEQILMTATDGLVGEFSNYADESYVMEANDLLYYIHYVTNASPSYITINTNGLQEAVTLSMPPRPSNVLIVDDYDQRYMAYDYEAITGTWTGLVSAAQSATAVNPGDFSITTNTPNGRPCVVNSGNNGEGTAMNFTRESVLATSGFTIQAVIRMDPGNTDSRQAPFACAEASGWSGLYMGAVAGGTSQVRAGNLGNSGSGANVLSGSAANTLDTNGVWGVYTLVVDPTAATQMSATFDLLEDGLTAFTIESAIADATNWVGGISASGRLFGGEMGGGATATDNWKGAIADVVVYNRVLDSAELAANEAAFQTLYQNEIVYVAETGDVSLEFISGGTEVVVSWKTSVGSTFTLETSDTLTSSSWTPVESGITGTGADASVTVPVSGTKFFRAYGE
jgi:hypothetical protein